MKIVAVSPDGGTQPLLWLYEYKNSYQHPFLFREPIDLPAGTPSLGTVCDQVSATPVGDFQPCNKVLDTCAFGSFCNDFDPNNPVCTPWCDAGCDPVPAEPPRLFTRLASLDQRARRRHRHAALPISVDKKIP